METTDRVRQVAIRSSIFKKFVAIAKRELVDLLYRSQKPDARLFLLLVTPPTLFSVNLENRLMFGSS